MRVRQKITFIQLAMAKIFPQEADVRTKFFHGTKIFRKSGAAL
jgi:hypothetical protein